MIGLMGSDGELVWVSDCADVKKADSQIEDDSFNGPCLWHNLEDAMKAVDEYSGMWDGDRLVEVDLVVKEMVNDVAREN